MCQTSLCLTNTSQCCSQFPCVATPSQACLQTIGPNRLEVRTTRCGRVNPGSIPGSDTSCHKIPALYLLPSPPFQQRFLPPQHLHSHIDSTALQTQTPQHLLCKRIRNIHTNNKYHFTSELTTPNDMLGSGLDRKQHWVGR